MTHLPDLFARLRAELTDNILPFWMKHAPDPENGGFHGAVSNTLEVLPSAPRSAILCARILWTFSTAYRVLGSAGYRQMADYAYQTLTGAFWDDEYGGVYWSLNPDNTPLELHKHHYAQAFALYGLSEYVRATQNEHAKKLACKLFDLLEQHAFEPVYGGYTEGSSREWGTLEDMRLSDKDLNCRKSMNTLLHILEAYTNLLRIWDDPCLRSQHCALLEVFTEKVYDSRTGHLRLFFDDAWNSLENLDSYGHDIEASWLMWEAAGMHPDISLHERVRPAVIGLAESVLREGRDLDGSLFYEGRAGQMIDDNKHWWPQAEAMVGFANAYELSGDPKFSAAIRGVWRFIENHLIDRKYGDWFKETDRDGNPNPSHMKAGFWDCPYHHARACFELIESLAV
jgi:cellobiose epimerase